LQEEVLPRCETPRKALVREPVAPHRKKLPERGSIRDQQIEDRVLVIVISFEVFSANELQSRHARGGPCEISDITREFKYQKALGRHALRVGA
jgi:hypothetical protein